MEKFLPNTRTKIIEGKIYIPAEIRKKIKARKFIITYDDENIILKPVERNIEKYYRIIKNKKSLSPKKLDKKIEEETRRIMANEIY